MTEERHRYIIRREKGISIKVATHNFHGTRISKAIGAFARRQQTQDSTFASSPVGKQHPTSLLITIHRHTLRLSAQLALCRRADGPAVRLSVAVLLQCHQLLRAEGLVVDLGRRLDEVLQVCPCEEVAEEDKLAMVLVLDVDNAPAILAASDLAAGDDDGLLGTDDREGDDVLEYGLVNVSNPNNSLQTLIWALSARSSPSSSSLS